MFKRRTASRAESRKSNSKAKISSLLVWPLLSIPACQRSLPLCKLKKIHCKRASQYHIHVITNYVVLFCQCDLYFVLSENGVQTNRNMPASHSQFSFRDSVCSVVSPVIFG